jgi:hypothetical protein
MPAAMFSSLEPEQREEQQLFISLLQVTTLSCSKKKRASG